MLPTFYFDFGFEICESLIVPVLLAGQLLQLVLHVPGKLPTLIDAISRFWGPAGTGERPQWDQGRYHRVKAKAEGHGRQERKR
jgi:hypothetical protein